MPRNSPQVNIEQSHLEGITSNAGRLAKILDIAAEKYPGRFMQLPHLALIMFNLRRRPSEDSPDVQRVKNAFAQAKKIINDDYHRGARNFPEQGMRASYSDRDRALNFLEASRRRCVNAIRSYVEEGAAINANNIKDDSTKEWVQKQQKSAKKLDTQTRGILKAPELGGGEDE